MEPREAASKQSIIYIYRQVAAAQQASESLCGGGDMGADKVWG